MIACSWCGDPARWIGHHNSGHDVPLCHPCALALRRPAIVSWTTVPLTDEQAADPYARRQEWRALTADPLDPAMLLL